MVYDNLVFRRQYILCPNSTIFPRNWPKTAISDYYIYTHPDIPVLSDQNEFFQLILVGELFDNSDSKLTNKQIFNVLLKSKDFKELIQSTYKYAGRYILIFYNRSEFKLFHDPVGQRKVYYTKYNGNTWVASQPHLFSEFFKIEINNDESIQSYVKSNEFYENENAMFSNITYFKNIYLLSPNHYFDIQKNEAIRYWPNKKLTSISLIEGAIKVAEYLQGFIECAAQRYKLMIPLTAGTDSRQLVAASKNITNNIYYYINNNPNMLKNSNDLKIPFKVLQSVGLKLNIHEYSEEVNDEDFIKVYKKNNFFASDKNLPLIYHVYFKKFQDYINLPGTVIGIAKSHFNAYGKKITGELLARLNKLDNNSLAISEYEKWLKNTNSLCKEYKIRVLDLFYWEERLANWGTQIQVDKDIAQEDFLPFNCRDLLINLLSVNQKYRLGPTFILFKKITNTLWPELSLIPFNPSFKNFIIAILVKLRIEPLIRRVFYAIKIIR